jgi:penicillin-binding protein 1B
MSGIQRQLRDLGLSEATLLPSAALGAFPATPVEIAGAYTVFPGGGTVVSPLLVTDVDEADGTSIFHYDAKRKAILSAASAALTTSILQGVVSDGTGARVRRYDVGDSVGGKTGTTDGYRDAWFVGFTPELVVAVWVGTDRGAGIGLSGSRAAIPLWGRFVAGSGMTGGTFPRPPTVATVSVCAESERIARDACPNTYQEVVPRGHEPNDKCDEHGGPLVEVGGMLQRLFRGLRRDRNE